MQSDYKKLIWQENKNGFVVDFNLDLFIDPAESEIVFLAIPGVDGSANGYGDKYVKISESYQKKTGATIMRMSNPFVSSLFWHSNIRKVLEFILINKKELTGSDNIEIHIMAHSAGAAVIAQIAWEYPEIKKLLLVNTAFKLKPDEIIKGLDKYKEELTFVFGSKDPSLEWSDKLENEYKVVVINDADHNFSGDAFPEFLELSDKYL